LPDPDTPITTRCLGFEPAKRIAADLALRHVVGKRRAQFPRCVNSNVSSEHGCFSNGVSDSNTVS
jgi:hypothetical protein